MENDNQKLDKKMLESIKNSLLSSSKKNVFEFTHEGKKYLADDLGSKIHFRKADKPNFYCGVALYTNKAISEICFLEEPIHVDDASALELISQEMFKPETLQE